MEGPVQTNSIGLITKYVKPKDKVYKQKSIFKKKGSKKMTKNKILEIIDKLIDDEKEALDEYHDAIIKLNDSPRLVNDLKNIYDQEAIHITNLDELKKAIEGHEEYLARMERDKLFGTVSSDNRFCDGSCCSVYGWADDGIVITEDEKEKKD